MKIKGLFFTITLLIILIIGTLSYFTFHASSLLLFIITEASALLIFIGLLYFYRRIIQPIYKIGNGVDLLKEQDFGSRLRKVGQPEVDRIVDLFNKMMTQLKNERLHMLEQNHFLESLIQASPMGVVILDLDGCIEKLNPTAIRLLGADYTHSPVKAIHTNLPHHDSELLSTLSTLNVGEAQMVRLNDASIYKCTCSTFADRGFQRYFFLIETLTEEMFKAEKKAYEKVIRMISHEVNNSTAGITSTLDTVQMAIGQSPENSDLVEVLRIVMERCYSLSHFITGFADVVRIPEPDSQPVNLNQLIRNYIQFMESMCLNRGITLTLELCPDTPTVNMDTALFEQVLVNIIKNATESIGQDGRIIISTLRNPDRLIIADSGPGISKEAASKLFTPFYSTKPNGQGLGLIFIREVLNKHHFTFSLHTDPDGLTRFCIQF